MSWSAVVTAVREGCGGTVMVVGDTDTGKTTFCAYLLGKLSAQERVLGFVDADVGQSTVGPPGTISLAVIQGPFLSFRHARPLELRFIGDVSPAGHVRQVVECVGRLVRGAKERDVWSCVVDTTGLFSGLEGAELKRGKFEVVRPDHVVVLEHAVSPGGRGVSWAQGSAHVHHLQASPCVRRRSQAERAAHRLDCFQRYFREAVQRRIPIGDSTHALCEASELDGGVRGLLVGLLAEEGNLLALGVGLELSEHSLVILAPHFEELQLARVELGSWRLSESELGSLGS